jgi:ribose transport system substrate-binding protein
MTRIQSIFILLVGILLASACTDSATDKSSAPTGENKTPVIGLVMKSLANEFFVNMADQAEQHQKANSDTYSLIVNGTKNESDLAQQVVLINQMIASKVDAIVLAPADSKAVIPAVVKAMNAGIVVINIDNQLDQDTLAQYKVTVPFVGPNNKEGAFMVAEFAANQLQSGDAVLLLEGITSAFNSQQRRDGFLKAIEQYGLNSVAIQSASWEQTKAAQVTSSLLIQHPQTKAIFAANDNMALGALAAVKRANLAQAPIIVGFDNIQAISPHIQSGDILATVDQFGGQLAIFGIEKALAVLAGEPLEPMTQTELALITGTSTSTSTK